jgi:FRG domain
LAALCGEVLDWVGLAELARRYTERGGWIFRGQSFPHGLRPKIGRPSARRDIDNRALPYSADDDLRMFENFERRSRPYLSYQPQGKLEWLAIAQHHGLPTRLLDWSESFLAATYFAVEKSGVEGPAAIYALKINEKAVGSDDPFKLSTVSLYRPPHIAPRIAAQQGVFTVHPNPNDSYQSCELEQWLIFDKRVCFNIKRQLDTCGINRSVLFPDIDGLAGYLEWRYKWSQPMPLT